MKQKWTKLWLAFLLLWSMLLGGCGGTEIQGSDSQTVEAVTIEVEEGGSYTTPEEVALYLHTYGELPDNFITKKEAEELGWDSKEGNLW